MTKRPKCYDEFVKLERGRAKGREEAEAKLWEMKDSVINSRISLEKRGNAGERRREVGKKRIISFVSNRGVLDIWEEGHKGHSGKF